MQESALYQSIKEEGREEGREEGAHQLALQFLSMQMGPLSNDTIAQVQQLSSTQLPSMMQAAGNFSTLTELVSWLQSRSFEVED
ncbi:MAG: DUF4351 domain-containing protein [Phormidesmis sp.]